MAVYNQHYIPQLLIENWADKNGRLLRYNYKYGKFKEVTSKGIFYKKLFYEMSIENIDTCNKIENRLSKYESEFSTFIREQRSSNFVIKTDDDELMYKRFVAFQLSRSKSIREIFDKIDVKQDVISVVYYLMFGVPEYTVTALHNSGYSDFHIETISGNYKYNLFTKCFSSMKNMGVRMLKTDFDKVSFLLYENPVLIDGKTGFVHSYRLEEFKYIMPIYPNVAIGITKKKCLIHVPPRIIERAFVHDVNFGLHEAIQNRNCEFVGSRICDIELLKCMYNIKGK